MLTIDSRYSYGIRQGGEFSMQNELLLLKIIYVAACADNPTGADLKARLSRPEQDTVRLLSDIITSPDDALPHLTLLYTQPANQQQILHIRAKFNPSSTRWEYLETAKAQAATNIRDLIPLRHIPWSAIESYGKNL